MEKSISKQRAEACLEGDLVMLIGTAMLADDDMKNYITRGVEAAQYAENKKKQKNDKADC